MPLFKQKVNISGTANPTFPSAIGKNYVGQTMTTQTSDSGIVYYGAYQFNWSTIMNTDPSTGAVSWTFSQAGSPTATCKAVATTADYQNGAHSVQFMITQ